VTIKSQLARCGEWHPTFDEQCELDAGHHGPHQITDPEFRHEWLGDSMRRVWRDDEVREDYSAVEDEA
jgi:hypothetical protein